MHSASSQERNPVVILKSAYSTIFTHPVILYPLCLMAFIELLTLEILFFAPRPPLAGFFAPLITQFEGEPFLRYPYNFILLAKWFDRVQLPLYVVFHSFFIGALVMAVHFINEDQKLDMRKVLTSTLSRYIHLFLAALLSVGLIIKLSEVYQSVLKVTLLADPNMPLLIRRFIFYGDNFIDLFITVVVMTVMAFIVPIIVIERRGFLAALIRNFRNQFKSWWFTFIVMLLTSVLYVPVLLLRMSWQKAQVWPVPELAVALLAASIFVLLFIEAIRYTAVTTYYLLQEGK